MNTTDSESRRAAYLEHLENLGRPVYEAAYDAAFKKAMELYTTPLTAAEKSRISCRRTEAARDALWAALRPSPVAVAMQAAEIARNAAMTRAVIDDVLAEVCGTEFAAAHEPRAVVSGARGVISLGNAVLTVRGDRFTVLPIGYTSRAPLVEHVPCPADLADFLLEVAAEPRLSHHAACA